MWAMRKPDFGGGEEFARALAGAFGEFAEQVLVGAAQEVGLHVGEAQAVAGIREGLDNGGEAGWVEVTHAVTLGCEIHEVNDTREGGVEADDGAYGVGQALADVARACTAALFRREASRGTPAR